MVFLSHEKYDKILNMVKGGILYKKNLSADDIELLKGFKKNVIQKGYLKEDDDSYFLSKEGEEFISKGGFSREEKQKEKDDNLYNSTLEVYESTLKTNASILETNESVKIVNKSVEDLNEHTKNVYKFQKWTAIVTLVVAISAIIVPIFNNNEEVKTYELQLLKEQNQRLKELNIKLDSLKIHLILPDSLLKGR